MQNLFPFSKSHCDYFMRHGQKVEYRKKQLMIWPADDTQWVYFLDKGLVKVSCFYEDGSESILGYFLSGQTFAQNGSFFSQIGGADLEFTAVEPSTVYRVTRNKFFEQMAIDQEFSKDYTTMILRNQLALIDRVVYLGENMLAKRCVRWLFFMAKFYGERDGKSCHITIPLTQDTIASLLHITRESTGKNLRQLIKNGHIRMEKKRITIIDIHKLQSLL